MVSRDDRVGPLWGGGCSGRPFTGGDATPHHADRSRLPDDLDVASVSSTRKQTVVAAMAVTRNANVLAFYSSSRTTSK